MCAPAVTPVRGLYEGLETLRGGVGCRWASSQLSRALLTDLPLRAVEHRDIEIRRRIRRLNYSGVEPARGHRRWIGDVRYASDSGRVAACREPSRRANGVSEAKALPAGSHIARR